MRVPETPSVKRAELYGTVTRRAASVRVAVYGRKRSLHVEQRGAARKKNKK